MVFSLPPQESLGSAIAIWPETSPSSRGSSFSNRCVSKVPRDLAAFSMILSQGSSSRVCSRVVFCLSFRELFALVFLHNSVSSHMFNSQIFKLRVSNPKVIAYFHFKMPFEHSNLAGAGHIFPDLTFENWPFCAQFARKG